MRFFHDIGESLSIAVQAIKANPLRSALTMLGIIIGIFTTTIMGAFIDGMEGLFRQSSSAMMTDVYFVD